jgi:hypothetical protein
VSGPFYRWNTGFLAKEIKVVHDYVQSVIDDEGPFDGVMGFSEGAAIATSLLIQHEIDHPKDPPPFNFAIIFSCGIVVSHDNNFARKEYEYAQAKYPHVALKALQNQDVSKVEEEESKNDEAVLKQEEAEEAEEADKPDKKTRDGKIRSRLGLLRPSKRAALVAEVFGSLASAARIGAQFHGKVIELLPPDLSGGVDAVPRLFHPQLVSERVKIPTVFVTGRNDPFYKHCQISKRLFSKDNTRFLEHAGAHDLPRLDREIKSVVSATQLAIAKSQMSPARTWRNGFRK